MSNFKLKSIWKDEDKAKINDIKNQIAQLQTTINALQTQLTTLSNEAVKLSGNQTIDGEKSFNAALNFPNRKIATTTTDNMTIAHINAQSQKFLKFDFEQTTGGFQNYGWLQMNAKYLNNAWSEIFSIGFKNQDNAANQGVWMNCSNNKFIFSNPTLVSGIQTPVGNNDAANKSYVDAIKTKIKEMASTSSDFANFKSKVGAW